MNLESLGWNADFRRSFDEWAAKNLTPARVVSAHRDLCVIMGEFGQRLAEVSGRFRHAAQSKADYPATGDWTAADVRTENEHALIHAVLPRRSSFSRNAAGKSTTEQVVAANIDITLLVCGLDLDFNLRRLERYLAAAWDSGATPEIVLNKADLCDDTDARVAAAETVAVGVPIHVVSAVDGRGLDGLRASFRPGVTVALLGSSGVGKSSIVNALLGEQRQRVSAVRESDSHGRHTTTHREIVHLPEGGMLLDTPGMRELAMWSDDTTSHGAFGDIDALVAQCRFSDCGHTTEPGCAVRAAIEAGELDEGRLRNYRALEWETMRQTDRRRQLEQINERQRAIAKARRRLNRENDLRH